MTTQERWKARKLDHVSVRFRERYGKRLTVQMYEHLLFSIQNGLSEFLCKDGKRSIHAIGNIVVVYSRGTILTVLPENCRERAAKRSVEAVGKRLNTEATRV